MEQYFEELNEELKLRKEKLKIIIVGGFVLELAGIRTTHDIDAFYTETANVREAIETVGARHELNLDGELWLNNNVQNLNKLPNEDDLVHYKQYSHLDIYHVGLIELFGLKMQSAREQDVEDMGAIISKLEYKHPKALMKVLKKSGFSVDESLVYEAFGRAYGLEWLEEYFLNHSF